MAGDADLVRLVGLEPVQRVAVLVGEDGDGADTEFVGGAERPNGDFPAVGDQHFGEHAYPSPSAFVFRPCRLRRASTSSPRTAP